MTPTATTPTEDSLPLHAHAWRPASAALLAALLASLALVVGLVASDAGAKRRPTDPIVGNFAVWGDTRNESGFTTAAPGFLLLVDDLEHFAFTDSITVGDYTYAANHAANDAARYDSFLAAAQPLTQGRRTVWTIGNHELVGNATDHALWHQKLFGESVPVGCPASAQAHHWGPFTLAYGTVAVNGFVLSTAEGGVATGSIGYKTDVLDLTPGSDWLTQTQQARDLVTWIKERGTQEWVVVALHHPLYDAKIGMPYDTSSPTSEKMKLVDLFHRYGVDLVLQGDVHYYRRHVQPDGTTYLTQGMGGAGPRTESNPGTPGAPVGDTPFLDTLDFGHLGSPSSAQKRYGWTVFSVSRSGIIRGATYYTSVVTETVGSTTLALDGAATIGVSGTVIELPSGHPFLNGDTVTISGCPVAGLNGSWAASACTSTTLAVPYAGPDQVASGGEITGPFRVPPGAPVYLESFVLTQVPRTAP